MTTIVLEISMLQVANCSETKNYQKYYEFQLRLNLNYHKYQKTTLKVMKIRSL